MKEPFNAMQDGTCRTLKQQYYKVSGANFIRQNTMGATGVIEIEEMEGIKPKAINLYDENGRERSLQDRIYDINGIATAVTTSFHPNIMEEPMSRQDNIAYKVMPNGNTRAYDASTSDKRGISELQITNPDNYGPTLTTSNEPKVLVRYRIRKLTHRECFRLMDMDEADIDKIDAYRIKKTLKDGTVKEKPIPKSQKYKMAGNSIVVSCLYHIFYQMFLAEPSKPQPKQLLIFG